MGRKYFITTTMMLILLQGGGGCDGGGSGSGEPSPGDPCDVLDVEKCSANHLYVLRCEEESQSGELHYFIHEECDDNMETCSTDEDGDAVCACDNRKCNAHCVERDVSSGRCEIDPQDASTKNCICRMICSDIQEGQDCPYELSIYTSYPAVGCCTTDGQNVLVCGNMWELVGPCDDGCSYYEGVEDGYSGYLSCLPYFY